MRNAALVAGPNAMNTLCLPATNPPRRLGVMILVLVLIAKVSVVRFYQPS
jgi:hypothetical protein